EATVRLPETYWCYAACVETPVSDVPSLAAGHVTYGCLNNFAKVTEESLTTWAEVMASVLNSRLLLHASPGSHRQRVLDLFARHGIGPERIEFVSMQKLGNYFDLYRRIDIVLDPFPYAGGTTTCDALWMGVPVVTLAGRTAVGRGGMSIL